MKIRPKLFLLIFAVTFASLLLLCGFSYWQSSRAIEASLRDDLRREADWLAQRIDLALRQRENGLVILARTRPLRDYLRCHPPTQAVASTTASPATARKALPDATSTAVEGNPVEQLLQNLRKRLAGCPGNPQDRSVSPEMGGTFAAFMLENRHYYGPISVLDGQSVPLFQARIAETASTKPIDTDAVTFQTQDLPLNNSGPDSISGDSKFVHARDERPLSTLLDGGPMGPTLLYTVPVLSGPEDPLREAYPVLGALVVNLKLDQLFKEQASEVEGTLHGAPTGLQTAREVIVLQTTGRRIYYHSNSALSHQLIASAMPDFQPVADAMIARERDARFYDAANNDRWLAAYRPLDQFDLSLAVASNYTRAAAPANRAFLINLLVSVLIAFAGGVLLTLIAQRRSGSISRLTQGAVAIARGRLDQQLVVSSPDNQLLADSVNTLTARLREQLAREAESRQFDSFMRLSAMLAHDLKNAITSLSLLVSNMERNFDRAEFRADALNSLKEATGKLERLVSKLSEPVYTMSGEHKRPLPTDLVPLIRRVLHSVTDPATQFHGIEINLPHQLVAQVEAERMEKVIENLIINSLEAMAGKKGVLTIAGGAAGEKNVFFSVTDTGPGMSRDFQERRLFHPFATTKQGGVGLGLYTCREVVRAHGGAIEVSSEVGVGTTFKVVLPSGQTAEQ